MVLWSVGGLNSFTCILQILLPQSTHKQAVTLQDLPLEGEATMAVTIRVHSIADFTQYSEQLRVGLLQTTPDLQDN